METQANIPTTFSSVSSMEIDDNLKIQTNFVKEQDCDPFDKDDPIHHNNKETSKMDPKSSKSPLPVRVISEPSQASVSIHPISIDMDVQQTPQDYQIIESEYILMERTASGRLTPWRPVDILAGDEIEVVESLPEFRPRNYFAIEEEEGEHDENRLRDPVNIDSGSEADEDDDYHLLEDLEQEEDPLLEDNEGEGINEEDPPNFNWSSDYSSFLGVKESFNEASGPKIEGTSPLGLFTQLWDQTLMETIVVETNRYARNFIAVSHQSEAGIPAYSRVKDWTETSVPELYTLISVLIIMSFCLRGRVDEYWSSGPLHMPNFKKLMTKNRFLLLMRFLHFTDNSNMPEHGFDRKLRKVKPIIDYLNIKFQAAYTPRRELSLDESLLLWKGRLSWAQCIRTKAARFGIKSYELCEAATGYVLNIIIYTGKNTWPTQSIFGFTNSTAKIVLSLFKNFMGKGYALFMDNYYNSVKLARFLKLQKTDVVGTLNRRKCGTPPDIQQINDKRMPRGGIVSRHCGDLSVLAWKDVRLVTTLSTYHNADTVLGLRSGKNINKPAVIADYNRYMGGVDLKDQKLSRYLMERKRGLKWYIKVFRRFLNISILNSYIIYCANIGKQQKLSHRQYRMLLAEELATKYGKDVQTRQRGDNNPCCRLDKYLDHFPEHIEVSGERSGKQDRFKRGRCVRCAVLKKKYTKSNILCSQCKVFLCIGQCWREFHTLKML